MAIIGIDATALSTSASGGIGNSQYQTMRALAELDVPHRFLLYSARPCVVPFSDRPLDLPWSVRLGSGHLASSNIVWMQTGVNRLLADDRVEVFWGPRHLLPFRASGVATVATVHDFWDRYYPGQQPWLNRRVNRLLIAKVIARADVVVVPSDATARDATRFFGPVAGGVRVVPWGVDTSVFRPLPAEKTAAAVARLGIKGPYLLSLDVFNPRKNFLAVLEGVARLPENMRKTLTVVGVGGARGTASVADLEARGVALGLSESMRFLSDVSLEDLVALYSGALAFVYPSIYEGFGMPVLEAMACGCPVVTADRSSLPEVTGNAAILVDPTNVERLSGAIALVATDAGERARLAIAGSARVAGFTWRRTAEDMVAAFEQALALRAGSAVRSAR
jgi:glycosyltransferase involved in cell wall biosynthesis